MEDVTNYFPIFIFVAVVIGFAATNLILTHLPWIKPWKKSKTKDMPYESGMDPIGDARGHFDIKFYLIAILFLIFDVELLFLYPWAVSAYVGADQGGVPAALSWPVFLATLGFLTLLTLGFVYEWRKGGFKWR